MQSQDLSEAIVMEMCSLMENVNASNPFRFSSVTLHAVVATHNHKRQILW